MRCVSIASTHPTKYQHAIRSPTFVVLKRMPPSYPTIKRLYDCLLYRDKEMLCLLKSFRPCLLPLSGSPRNLWPSSWPKVRNVSFSRPPGSCARNEARMRPTSGRTRARMRLYIPPVIRRLTHLERTCSVALRDDWECLRCEFLSLPVP